MHATRGQTLESRTIESSNHRRVGDMAAPSWTAVLAQLEPLEEHIGGSNHWPAWLRGLAIKDWLLVNERLALALNLLGNVSPPFVTARHMRAASARHSARCDTHTSGVACRNSRRWAEERGCAAAPEEPDEEERSAWRTRKNA